MESLPAKFIAPIAIARVKEYKINSFVMEYHECGHVWTPKEKEIMQADMEPNNKMDKFTASVLKIKRRLVTSQKEKQEDFQRLSVTFLKSNRK